MPVINVTNARDFIVALARNPHARCEVGADGRSIDVISGASGKLAMLGKYGLKAANRGVHNHQSFAVAQLLAQWGDAAANEYIDFDHEDESPNGFFSGFGRRHISASIAARQVPEDTQLTHFQQVVSDIAGQEHVDFRDLLAKTRKLEFRAWATNEGLDETATVAQLAGHSLTGSLACLATAQDDPALEEIASKQVFHNFTDSDYAILIAHGNHATKVEAQQAAALRKERLQQPNYLMQLSKRDFENITLAEVEELKPDAKGIYSRRAKAFALEDRREYLQGAGVIEGLSERNLADITQEELAIVDQDTRQKILLRRHQVQENARLALIDSYLQGRSFYNLSPAQIKAIPADVEAALSKPQKAELGIVRDRIAIAQSVEETRRKMLAAAPRALPPQEEPEQSQASASVASPPVTPPAQAPALPPKGARSGPRGSDAFFAQA
jgi:hypothetical protein